MTLKMNNIEHIKTLARRIITDLKPFQSAREEFIAEDRKMILLDANENPNETEFNRYPDPMQLNLKTCISEIKEVSINQIFLSNGSDEVFSQLIQVFCEPRKDNVIILPPTFGMYKICATINGIAVKEVPLNLNFGLNIEKIIKTKDLNSKMIFVPSPNNPTGNCFSLNDIELILNNFDGLVVLDEAYVEFSKNNSFLPRLNKFMNLIVTQTFSKAQGMAGARLGMTFAHPEIIKLLNKLKTPYNINSLTQQAIINRLTQQVKVENEVKILLIEKDRLSLNFKKIKYIKKVFPSNANFILIRVDDSTKRYKELLKRGIVVRNTSNQLGCKNTLRISVGTKKENNALINALSDMDN